MYRRHPRSPPFPYTALFHSPAPRTSRGMPFDALARPLSLPSRADPRMEKFIIEGGTPLAGTVTPAGNKNAALPALAACLLTAEEVVLRNIPRISDVEAMLDILRLLEVSVEWRDDNVVALQADGLTHFDVDRDLA